MNQQVKAGLKSVKDFLAGRSGEEKRDDVEEQATREVVGADLVTAKSGVNVDDPSGGRGEKASGRQQELPRFEPADLVSETTPEEYQQQQVKLSLTAMELIGPEDIAGSSAPNSESASSISPNQESFDEAVQNLRTGNPAERAAAARALGSYRNKLGTPHLIAAMFDDDADVRNAAEEALAQIGDPTVSSIASNPVLPVLNEPEVALSDLADALHSPEVTAEASKPEFPALSQESAIESHIDSKIEQASAKRKARDRSGRFLPASKARSAASATSKVADQDEPGTTETASSSVSLDAAEAGEIEALATGLPQEENQSVTSSAAVVFNDPRIEREIEELKQEEQAVRDSVEQLGQKVIEVVTALKDSETEVIFRIEREELLRAEAAEKRREEEGQRKRAAEEAEAVRVQEREALAAEQAARIKAESDARRYAEEQTNLRLKAARLRLAADELVRRRGERETARLEAAEANRRAEATRARDEAKSRHEAALKRLRSEEEALQAATTEVAQQQANLKTAREKAESEVQRLKEEQAAVEAAQRAEAERLKAEAEAANRAAEEQLRQQLETLRQAQEEIANRSAEVEAARAKAEADAERLVEAQARMRAAEEARAQTEAERLRLEAEIDRQVETQLQLLEDTRRRGEAEEERLQAEIQRQAQVEQERLAELEVTRAKAELESRQRAEKEQQILGQIDSMRISDAETRRRIEDAEVRRRAAEDAYRLVAEKVQRVEAEAHARAKEEERIIAKLEAERRTVAVEAQSREEQVKRIKEEIEMFRRLEEQERPRLEEATLQLADAESRLQERKERIKAEEEALARAEAKLSGSSEFLIGTTGGPAAGSTSPEDSDLEMGSAATLPVADQTVQVAASDAVQNLDELFGADDLAASAVTPAIASYLNSVDPYKRAAAVSELARSGGQDALVQIVECFDDPSPHVRNAAARALRKLEPTNSVDLFNRSLEGASEGRRRNIGAAIAASGLAKEAIDHLGSENREETYNALSILFVMAKTGEVDPLVKAIEEHDSLQVRMAVIKLLTLAGQGEAANAAAKRRLENNSPETATVTATRQ